MLSIHWQMPIVVYEFKQHQKLKQPLLNSIQSMPAYSINNISKCDYNSGYTKPYWNILSPAIKLTIHNILSKLDITDGKLSTPWYQQYHTNDSHNWHRHPNCTYNVVYYLELPGNTPPTLLRHPLTKELITPSVHEGSILLFPSCIQHCSPINQSTHRKTIIAFNIE